MSVFLRVDINIIAMILLGTVCFIAYKRLDKQDSLNRVFLRVSLIIILQLFFETITCIINQRPEKWLIPIAVFLHIGLFSISSVMAYYWYILVKNLVIPDEANYCKRNILLLIPVAISIFLAVLSPIYNFVFTISSLNVYERGPLFLVSAAITYLYIFCGFILIVKNKRKIVKQEFAILFIFSILPIIGGIVQTLFYGALLMWSSVAFSLVIVYIFLQQRMVQLDDLTGTWNRSSFDYYITQRLKQKTNEKFGIIYVDIDGLKNINDRYGHVEGDFAIKTSITIIKSVIRKNDIIVRMGGDEFVIILDCESNQVLEKTIERITEFFAQYNKNSGKNYNLACSFGADIFDSNFSSIEQFLHHVDNLMYQNKKEKCE